VLEKDPEKRLSLKQITEHGWFIETQYDEFDGFELGKDLVKPSSVLK